MKINYSHDKGYSIKYGKFEKDYLSLKEVTGYLNLFNPKKIY